VVAFVAALARHKGPDLAVKTMSLMPDAHLLVVGAGPEERMTRSLAAELLDGRVTFLGNTANMRSVYAASDVLLVPSRTDAMPAVVIEAGLMGVPTVAADVGALSAMITSDVTGALVDSSEPALLAKAVRPLLLDPTRRQAIGSAARDDFLERFDLGIVSRQWSEVLEEAAERGTRRITRETRAEQL
jgi:glycosyltransferase involved in cell wall biosynthesis